MKKFKQVVLVLCLVSISGCAYLGGFFDREDECQGAACRGDSLIDGRKSGLQWYCYGKEAASDWQCKNEKDPSKIVAVVPKSRASENSYRRPAPEVQPEPIRIQVPTPLVSKPVSPPSSKVDSRKPLLDEPAGSFAVQLLASPEKDSVIDYAKTNGISDPLYARINHQNSNWYVLLLGIYASRADATEAKEFWMKNKNLKVKPWIRELGPLQDAIRAAGNG